MTSGYYGQSINSHPHGGTPDDLLKQIEDEFGPLFDPCPNGFKIDGLSIDWPMDKTAYVNPPYTRGQIGYWVEKCHQQFKRGIDVVMLIPSYTDTKYFHNFIYGQAELRFIKGRLAFKGYEGKPASFPSMLVVFKGVPE